jgi:hypothetical protein
MRAILNAFKDLPRLTAAGGIFQCPQNKTFLILRSAPQERVSKDALLDLQRAPPMPATGRIRPGQALPAPSLDLPFSSDCVVDALELSPKDQLHRPAGGRVPTEHAALMLGDALF